MVIVGLNSGSYLPECVEGIIYEVRIRHYAWPRSYTARNHTLCTDGAERGGEMSIFPTKILLATDGSREARLAARIAVDLARKPTPKCTSSTSLTSP